MAVGLKRAPPPSERLRELCLLLAPVGYDPRRLPEDKRLRVAELGRIFGITLLPAAGQGGSFDVDRPPRHQR